MNARTTTRCLGLLTRTALLLGLLLNSMMGWAQGSEDFTNLPTVSSTNYLARTWTGTNAVTWTAAGARTDQTLTGKAICFGTTTNNPRTVTSPSYTGGMGTLTFNYVRGFTGTGARSIEVWVNGTQVGTSITVNATSSTVQNYSNAINTAGNVVLEIRCTGASQVIIDDIAWTGFVIQDPVITSMTPAFATAGASAFTLSVSGSNYISGLSTVRWNGATRTTTFVSSGQLDASISSADVASAGSATVDVITTGAANPSNSLIFTINPNTGPDCLGTIGGTALPGTTCDDANTCTINDVWSAGCVCGGTVQDTDGDGVCDANDNCPNIAGQQGTSCSDGDPCTINDVLDASCVCSGTLDNTDTDGDGVPNCQDGCPLDGSKISPGLCGCGVLEVGNVCDDGNACTTGDIYVSCGVCAGTSPSDLWNFGTTVGNAAASTVGLSNAVSGSVSGGNSFGTTTLLSTTSASNNSGASGQYNAGIAARAGALNTDANGSAYFELTVTPAAGYGFTLNGISFGTRSTSSGPVSYSLRSSTNNYATEVAGGAIANNSIWSPKSNVALSASSAGDQPITFRLYGYGSVGSPGSGTVNWRIDDLSISGCTVALPAYTFTVSRSGAGTVTSEPVGIFCGVACANDFYSGTQVTLTATPDAGSVFTGWSGGGCTGTGQCVCTVTGATTVSATFELDSDGDGLADGSDPCQATAAVTSSLLFNAATCGANPGAYLDYSDVSGVQVATAISACPAGSYCTGGTAPSALCLAGTYSSSTGQSTCASCMPGSYSSLDGATFCASCPQGQFSDVMAATTCTSCAAGTYNPNTGAVECLTCNGVTNTPTGATSCEPDSDGDGLPDSTDDCQATSAVTGSLLFSAATCGANPGAYLDFTTINGLQVATAISTCPAGSYCTGGTAPSALCPAGKFSDVTGSSVCQDCAAGSFSGADGATQCTSCAAGSFSSVTGATECTACAAGSFSSTTGSTTCTACDAGTYNPVTGATQCLTCSGQTNTPTGATSCTVFYSFTVTNTGGVASGVITSTPAGISCPGDCNEDFTEGTQVTLHATPTAHHVFTGWSGGACSGTGDCVVSMTQAYSVTGTFEPDSDDDGIPDATDDCQATASVSSSLLFSAATCGANPGAYLTYSDVGGVQVATDITTCPAGSSCAGGTAPAELCPAGRFSDVTGASVCQSCAAGSFSGVAGATQCTSCAAGSFSSVIGATECTACAAGSFSSVTGATECSACAAGSFSSTTGSTSCASCGAGTYNPTTGATECLTCNGTTNTPTGATSCTVQTFTVTVAISGSGSITSSPAGITNCNGFCSASFPVGTQVMLTASPALHRTVLWGGGSPCTNGPNPCVFTLTGPVDVIGANFVQDSDDDGIPNSSDGCQATAAVSGSPLFNAATCGANPGAYLTFSMVESVPVATDITTCPAGSSCAGGTAPAVACPAGRFSDVTGSVTCQQCAAGSFSSTTGATQCTACAAGSFSDVLGSTECTACAAGSFSSSEGATQCTACDAGKFSNTIGATQCLSCAAGTYNPFSGATECLSCTGGTDATTAATVCLDYPGSPYCPVGTATPTLSGGSGGGGGGGAIYTCSNGQCSSLVMNTATGEVDLAASAPGTYQVCASGACVDVVINPRPPVEPITGLAAGSSLCIGTPVQLSNATPGGVWSSSDPSVATVTVGGIAGGVIAAIVVAARYTVSDGTCTNEASLSFSVAEPPAAPAPITGGSSTCTGSELQLDSATPDVFWSSSDEGVATVSNAPGTRGRVTGVAAGTTTVRATFTDASTQCSSSVEQPVAVGQSVILDPPSVSQTGGTNPTCSSSPVEFHATGTYSDGSSYDSDVSYVWSPGGITINGNGFFSVSAPVSGDVSVSVTSSRVCASSTPVFSSNTISLVVTPTLSIDASSLAIEQTVGTPSTCSGSAMEFHLTGLYSDGSSATNDLSATWTDGVITITGQNFGFSADASSSSVSTSSVTSSRSCVSNSGSVAAPPDFTLSVTESVSLSSASLALSSGTNPTCSGSPRAYTAFGTFTDGSTTDSRPPGETQYDFYLNGALVQSSSNPLYEDAGQQSNPLFARVTSSRPCLSGSSSSDSPPVSLQVTAQVTYALDADNDDYYVTGSELSSCTDPGAPYRPVSVLVADGDCDDGDASVHPGATEVCDGGNVDEDCDGLVDEGSNVYYRDADGDAYGDVSVSVSLVCTSPPNGFVSNSGDCDDTDASVHPTATEVCDGRDDDCDGAVPSGETDDDGDGYVECAFSSTTWGGSVLVFGGYDCNDADASVHPGATEVCDGGNVDEDCDGLVDEGSNVYYRDADGDTYGDVSVSVSLVCTSPPSGFVSNSGDCDDTDASVHPSATEVCDGRDDDCDGAVPSSETDDDGDGYVECAFSSTTWGGSVLVFGGFDCNDADATVNPGQAEVCDPSDVDEDCDFSSTNGLVFVDYAVDSDNDNYFVSGSVVSECTDPGAPYRPLSVLVADGDCDDGDASVHPGATEVCDGSNVDEDCDGLVDEGDNIFFHDGDGDGFGDALVSVSLVCTSPPTGFVGDATDCDDTDASVHPNGTETCDTQDEDCDGFVDEGSNVFFADADGDTYGDPLVSVSLVCTSPSSGFVSDGGDCDDTDASRHPGASELCDGVDQDCDGAVDEGTNLFFADTDGDTFGDASVSVSLVCTAPPSGFVGNDQDCDDSDASIHPGATEVWYDGIDQNCNGDNDFDQDMDGYICSSCGIPDGTDCDDTDASVHPDATETCDGVDQDCDSFVDEGSNVFYRDADGDTYGDASVSVSLVCTAPPSGFVSNSDDCDDAHLLYADTDGDGIGAGAPVACGVLSNTDDCPSVQGVVGSSCDDGSTATINDALSASCVCTGTPACTTNPVTLTLSTDASAAQITWYVMLTGTNTAVCSGNGLASSSTVAVDCCLPNGCYDLVITDDFGDGIVGGGYVLRDGTGKRIIDNAGNGGSFTTLSLSPLGFCVPLGADALMAASCDVETATLTTVLRAEPNAAVTAQFGVHNGNSGYQYWVTNPNGGFSRRITLTHSSPGTAYPAGTTGSLRSTYFALSTMNGSSPYIPLGILLNVRVRSQVNGVYGNFGPACRLMLPLPTCATTQLTTTASPVISCGATGLTFSSVIWAHNVPGATGYQFEFSKPGYTRRILSPSRSQALSFVTAPLQMNNCYQVRVRISYDNSSTYCPFGPSCTITLGTANCGTSGMALEGSSDETILAEEARLSLWPNPNDGSTLNVSLTEFDATINVVSMDVTDVFGKLVATRTLPVQDGRLNTAVSFEQDLAPGLYLVNLTAGEHRYTERLVIQ